jgi:hypothetical protein
MSIASRGWNQIIQAVIRDFQPRFVPQAIVLCIKEAEGATSDGDLRALGLKSARRDAFPNVVFYDKRRSLLVLVDVAKMRRPMSRARCAALRRIFRARGARLFLVSAFQNRRQLQCSLDELPWGTSVWFADEPGHLIHFNGERFLGPH